MSYEKEVTTCGFNEAYIGKCSSKEIKDNGQCESHQSICCMCREQLATQTCCYSSFSVCGAPTCDDCNHYETHKGFRI